MNEHEHIVSASTYIDEHRDEIYEMFRRDAELDPLADAVNSAVEPRCRWSAIRAYYRAAGPYIKEAGKREWGVEPYQVNWLALFTPIELALWHDISAASCVLYPQYPVGRFFVDFANPAAKVAVECDGAAWHTDAEKDRARQAEIGKMGWSVYRISGRDCKSDFNEETRQSSAARIFIDRIAFLHGISRNRGASYGL
jgi:very-short-patch-repair endonuclease